MRFEWDEAKSDANLEERGFDFDFVRPLILRPDARVNGEERARLHLTVVYTDRQSARGQVTRRIISARRSSRHERKIYQKANP